jgi:hypothetical protein
MNRQDIEALLELHEITSMREKLIFGKLVGVIVEFQLLFSVNDDKMRRMCQLIVDSIEMQQEK